MTYMGFALGLRPSSMRPLRQRGPEADVKWDERLVLIRRSHTQRRVMDRTKTARDQEIAVPSLLLEVLRWHVETQLKTPEQRASDLLFPREDGGIRDDKVLRGPFLAVEKALGLKKHITPRAMRRSFQDLARTAEVRDIVTRSISGHATEQMQRRYSTVTDEEQASCLTRILQMMPPPASTLPAPEGEHLGEHRNPAQLPH
jgi:integrase